MVRLIRRAVIRQTVAKYISGAYLVFVLTLGDPLGADLDLGGDETLHHVIAVQPKQEGNLLSLCNIHSFVVTYHRHQ